jgi:beta-lactam-binding protein with PASTA domain/predicted Ser/Thr protein kinase
VSGINQGELVDGRYQIQRRLGTGGMADVYLAEDQQLERPIALKLLHRRFAEDPGFVERFRREAQAAANLQHPNIVAVYDRGGWDGTYYIAMEYLQGRTLKQVVRDEAPIDPVRAIDIVIQILKATRFAHRRGVIHRDLKPHNVMLDDSDHAKVADFGIARAGASDMTETGSIMGTAQYLSPEQAQGLAVAEGSDLYSVGVVLYELLTGRVPFDAESAVTIALKHVSEAPVPPSTYNPEIPPALEQTVLWALNKNAADRPQDADAFINVLEGIRESLLAGGGGGQVTASMTALSAAALGGADAEALKGAPGAAPRPRVQLGNRPPTYPSTATHPAVGDSGALAAVGPVGPPTGPMSREPRSRWSRTWPWLLALALALVLAGGVVAFVVTRPTKGTVPVVVELTQQSAVAKIDSAGFTPQVIQQASTSRSGTVIYQSPLGGTRVKTGNTVELTVSSGPGQTTVPAVVQDSEKQAIRQLHLSGLKVSRVLQEASSTVPKNEATRTDPDAGTSLMTGQSVYLYLSSGVAPIAVPSVTGDTLAIAQTALSQFTLGKVTQEPSATKPAGTVLSQTPQGGTMALPGSTVTLVVAASVTVPSVLGESVSQATSTLTALGLTYTRTYSLTDIQSDNGQVLSQNPGANQKATAGSPVILTIGRYSATATGTGTTTATTTGTGTVPGTATATTVTAPPTTATTSAVPVTSTDGSLS